MELAVSQPLDLILEAALGRLGIGSIADNPTATGDGSVKKKYLSDKSRLQRPF